MSGFSSIDLRSIRIERDQPETIFGQLCRQLRELILRGDLPIDARLPSTRILAIEIGVSRITVREVYEHLVAEGFLTSAAGKGTFVSHHAGLREAISIQGGHAADRFQTKAVALSDNISNRAKSFLSIPLSTVATQALPFNPAIPDLALFPLSKWSSVVKRSMIDHKSESMDYGDPAGIPALREALAHYLRLARGINCEADQVIITASSEQSIRRTTFLLLDPEDSVWFGEPGIYARRNVFGSTGLNYMTVPVDEQGVVVDRIYQYGSKAKLAYVLPYRHYPLGITMSVSRRLELLEWAASNNAWILEHDFASEFGLPGDSPPPIQSLDTEQRVIYMGGFGLSLFPGLRLSYAVFPRSLAAAAESIARSELAVSTALQPALAEFIAQDHYITHIRNMRKAYQRREDFLVEYLQQYIGSDCSISGVGGGTNIVLNLPSRICATKLSEFLAQKQVIAHPISSYFLQKPEHDRMSNGLILGFACSSRRELQQAAEVLVDML